ncbi:bifunctional triacylglycerol lipase/ester hydrolase [Aspergillus mulundensis]|uniref:AB hydrolase-1 domain-containing protein n=1 Tax=Aspergillus mulundensis TaxID=1810919 RepID=A0A3D8RK11_9EURO|nr:Uncharacterized protein DSM5745_06972 [Aspergillus mulundensis]RDW74310.1 Uncharacterized protein DSM5745_06972 [Aspergillus mulundensis]
MTIPKPHITPDSFFHRTTSSPSPSDSLLSPWPITIYFISGNPGLISYYQLFLSLLSSNIASSQAARQSGVHIVGHSLAGFELEPKSTGKRVPTLQNHEKQTPQESGKAKHIHNLEEQICFVQSRLDGHMRRLRRDSDPVSTNDLDLDVASEKPKVILIGHSVGTYIAMEILRRHRERQNSGTASNAEGDADADFDIVGGIMLFPTVLDIAKSPSGQKLTFLLRIIPQFALLVSLFARILTALLPTGMLRGLVRSVMRAPPESAVELTTKFLKSKHGVRQALHMAADEMRNITSDQWSDDVWGVSRSTPTAGEKSQPLSRLYFYFGRNDHWVAEQTREEILAARGGLHAETGHGPKMIVCEESVPHAFCLRHNETMANKVADMVQEIIE